ncbi:MAG: hypothetical protein RLZZ546_1046 [Bacteroidota bacterium]|jgi:uncharacterized damage-inducible protein DinB
MTQEKYIANLSNYNHWANEKICNWVNKLTTQQWEQELIGSFASIKKTVLHILAAESLWFDRINERPAKWNEEIYNNQSIEKISDEWLKMSSNLVTFCESQSEIFLEKIITYSRLNGDIYSQPLYEILSHVFNHSTYHRGQIITLLHQVGFHDVGSTDLLLFFRENN